MMNETEKPEMKEERYKVVRHFAGWKILDTYTDKIGKQTYTKEDVESLAFAWNSDTI